MATIHTTNTSVTMFEESPPKMKALLRANDNATEVCKGVATRRIALPPLSDKVE